MLTPELLDGLPDHNQLWLALSGGLDSVVLLDLAARYCADRQKPLKVIHVHHGLSPNADQWAQHCLDLCQSYQDKLPVSVHCRVAKVQLNGDSSIEEQARKERYQVFEDCLKAHDLILMAHHADDQLETMLLRLMRGAGSQGLSGIPARRPLGLGAVSRPLLMVERSELEAYAKEEGLSWVEDESNKSREFDRNFLRHEIVPRLKARWPRAVPVAGRSAEVLSDSGKLNDALARIDLEHVQFSETVLVCSRLTKLAPERQRNLMHFWLRQQGVTAPDFQHMQTILGELVLAQADAQPCFVRPEYELRRYRGQLFLKLTQDERGAGESPSGSEHQDSIQIPFSKAAILSLGGVVFHLTSTEGVEREVDASESAVSDCLSQTILLPESGALHLGFREGGESLRLEKRGRKTLKKLLQEAGVPAWLRDRVRLFWFAPEQTEPQLIGVWSPSLDQDEGVFWWHECVLSPRAGAERQANRRIMQIAVRNN